MTDEPTRYALDEARRRLLDYDPPPMAEQVRWAVEADSDAAIDATRLLLRHAVKCNVRDLCPTCGAIKAAVDG